MDYPRVPCNRLAIMMALLACASCSTARDAAVPLVRIHAEKDLSCSGPIDVEPLIGGRYQASGCGRTTTYNSACEQLRCVVAEDGEEAPPWRDRPEPGSLDEGR